MLSLPEQDSKLAYPLGTASNARVELFDGVPDAQDWMGRALAEAHSSGPARGTRSLQAFALEPLGAPYGQDTARSLRVARATGLVVSSKSGQPLLEGVAVAHGCCSASWQYSVEGAFLALEFQSPSAFGWGAGKDALALELLQARCLRQYESQALSVLAGVVGAGSADGILVKFTGEWDESTALVRRRLTQACVAHWCTQRNNAVTQWAV